MVVISNFTGHLKTLATVFLYIGIFLIPFNAYDGPSFLGEYRRHPCTYFFLISTFFCVLDIINRKRIYLPIKNIILQSLVVLLLWFIISTIFNFHNIIDYYFKGTSGVVRFIKQFGSLFISAVLILVTCIHVFGGRSYKHIFFSLRKLILLSFIVVCIYGILEILILVFGFKFLMPVLELFNYFPFTNVHLTVLKRISSVSFEPPELATYLICISGWMLSYILTETKLWKYLPAIMVLILTYFSDSRSGIAVILVQYLIFFILLFKKKRYRGVLKRIIVLSLIPISVLILFRGQTIGTYVYEKLTSFSSKNSVHGLSNQSRLGIQEGNIRAFLDRPISGAGFGQSAFVSKQYYPAWATKDNWEFRLKYLNPNHKPFPTVYNMYVRLLSESGVIGLILFLIFQGTIFITCYKLLKNKSNGENNEDLQLIGLVMLLTFIGISINWIKADIFRIFGFWVNLGFLIYLTGNRLKIVKKNSVRNSYASE